MASSQRNKTLSKNTKRLANEARQIISNNTPFHVFFITPPFFFPSPDTECPEQMATASGCEITNAGPAVPALLHGILSIMISTNSASAEF